MSNEVIEMEARPVTAPQQANQSRALTQATPSDLLRIAVEQGADIEKLEKLMALQERWEANQARKAYVEAMAAFKSNPPKILKDKHVEFKGTKYDHATLGSICAIVIDALAKHGFSHRWETTQPESGMIVVSCVLTHILGHSEATTLQAPPDNSGSKNAIQSIGSAVTYLQRYTLLAACGLATNDIPDDDGQGAGEKEKTIVRQSLTGKAFDKAIASIRAGEWTVVDIEKYYDLTADQKTAAIDAEKERK
jgi:hypothetical protein